MFQRGLSVIDAVIDNGFRGELFAMIYNFSDAYETIQEGDRIAQIIPQRVETFEWQEAIELRPSERGTKGFGSSGR
jgi:dUTP pyrophosphatase